MERFWDEIKGGTLAQGDFLPNCPIPLFPADFGTSTGVSSVTVVLGDLIVMTQSCDLENKKVILAAMCPILTIDQLASTESKYRKPETLEEIRKGRYEFLHMLASPNNPENNQDVRIVDFRQIFSLPVAFLGTHTVKLETRWRLKSPFLEHFSQSFARFFMRVGLPSAIPKFK